MDERPVLYLSQASAEEAQAPGAKCFMLYGCELRRATLQD